MGIDFSAVKNVSRHPGASRDPFFSCENQHGSRLVPGRRAGFIFFDFIDLPD